jgi:hypothetical protein
MQGRSVAGAAKFLAVHSGDNRACCNPGCRRAINWDVEIGTQEGGGLMNIPIMEVPERAARSDQFSASIRALQELVELRVGFPLQLAAIEPIEREGYMNVRIYWRSASPLVTVRSSASGASIPAALAKRGP